MSEFNRFRGSSKTFLICCMPVIILYFLGVIWKMIKTDSGTKKIANISDHLLVFIRVIEYELSFTYLMYFVCIELTAFHEISFICSLCLVVLTFLICGISMLPEKVMKEGELVENEKRKYFLLVCKIANVTLCVMAFIMIFLSDMSLDIAEDIEDYISYTPKKGLYPKWAPANHPSTAAAAAATPKPAPVPKSTPASGS